MQALVNLCALWHKSLIGAGGFHMDEESGDARIAATAQQMRMLAAKALVSAGRMAVDWALPPRCPNCGEVVGGDQQLCLACWQALDFLDGPACVTCSMPLVQAKGFAGMACGACMAEPHALEGAPAAVAYGAVARRLALRLKHGRKMGDTKLMARFMARHVAILREGAEQREAMLLPVPLHRWRLWSRGYNQSAVLADHIGRISGVAVDKFLLQRKKATPVLRGKGRKERYQIVRGAFSVEAKDRPILHGKHAILVDDVHASGATLRACASTLKRAGAARVSAVTWARVVPSAIMTANIFDFGAWDSDMGKEDQIR
jgi:ComF family protein